MRKCLVRPDRDVGHGLGDLLRPRRQQRLQRGHCASIFQGTGEKRLTQSSFAAPRFVCDCMCSCSLFASSPSVSIRLYAFVENQRVVRRLDGTRRYLRHLEPNGGCDL